jgi:hypothetical protein
MTIQEMHIAVNLGVQKIASFQVDNLLPQEIDHELNVAMDKFIKLRYSPLGNKYRDGFEQSQKRIDDLRNLVVDYATEANYQGQTVNNYFIDRAPLPRDYMFLVNFYVEEYYKCSAVNTEWITTSDITNYLYKVPLVNSNGIGVSDIINDGSTIFADLSEDQVLDAEFFLNPAFLTDSWVVLDSNIAQDDASDYMTGSNATFESHQTPTIDSNHVLLSAATVDPGNITVKYSDESSVTIASTEVSHQQRWPTQPLIIPITREMGMYVQHDDIYMVLSDPFNRPTYDRVKYTIQENFIDVYTDVTFLVKLAHIKYIRRPNRLNIIEGVGCELPEHTHQEIVEMAVKGILESVQDPRYQTQSMENMDSE